MDASDASGNPTSPSGHDDSVVGKKESRRRGDMATMITTMTDLKWDEPLMDHDEPFKVDTESNTLPDHSPVHWKSIIAEKKNEVMLDRMNIPTQHSADERTASSERTKLGDVRVVDRHYLTSAYISDEWEKVMTDISTDFSLNEEQTRAFRIVANHAASYSREQLKMYMGGMGGTGKTQVLRALTAYFRKR
ncbi:hypothetical protein H0H93_001787, partial [Arthromyces matolae]